MGRARCRCAALGSRVCETFEQSSFPRRRESTAGGPAMGFPSPRERRAAAAYPQSSARIHGPTIVSLATAGIHGGGAAMGSRLHGNDGRRRRTHNRQRESTAPQPSFPRRRESTAGGRRWVSRLHGNDGRRRRTHNRHSREWSYARVSLYGNDGARPCGSWSCTRAGRRPSPSRSRRRCWASGPWRSLPPARRRA